MVEILQNILIVVVAMVAGALFFVIWDKVVSQAEEWLLSKVDRKKYGLVTFIFCVMMILIVIIFGLIILIK